MAGIGGETALVAAPRTLAGARRVTASALPSAHAVALALSALFPSVGRTLHSPEHRDTFTVRAKMVEYACADAGLARCATLHAIVFVESGYRLRNARASLAACNPYGTDDWQQATCAARSLASALRRCHATPRALNRYQYGECAVPRGRRHRRARARAASYVRNVTRIATAIERFTSGQVRP